VSKHFKFSALCLLILSLGLWFVYRKIARRINEGRGGQVHTPTVLPQQDKERISYDEKTHTLEIQTATKDGKTKTVKEYARNPVVEIRKNGSVVVQRHLTGFENEPFLGVGYADTGRFFVGDNLLHLSRFDVVGAVAFTTNHRFTCVQPFVGVGYNLYHNTSVNLVVNPLSGLSVKGIEIGGFVSIKI